MGDISIRTQVPVGRTGDVTPTSTTPAPSGTATLTSTQTSTSAPASAPGITGTNLAELLNLPPNLQRPTTGTDRGITTQSASTSEALNRLSSLVGKYGAPTGEAAAHGDVDIALAAFTDAGLSFQGLTQTLAGLETAAKNHPEMLPGLVAFASGFNKAMERNQVDTLRGVFGDKTPQAQQFLMPAINELRGAFNAGAALNLGGPSFASFAKAAGLANSVDVSALVQWVLRESYMEQTRELSYFAEKVRFYNDMKKQIRDHLTALRAIKTQFAGTPEDKAAQTDLSGKYFGTDPTAPGTSSGAMGANGPYINDPSQRTDEQNVLVSEFLGFKPSHGKTGLEDLILNDAGAKDRLIAAIPYMTSGELADVCLALGGTKDSNNWFDDVLNFVGDVHNTLHFGLYDHAGTITIDDYQVNLTGSVKVSKESVEMNLHENLQGLWGEICAAMQPHQILDIKAYSPNIIAGQFANVFTSAHGRAKAMVEGKMDVSGLSDKDLAIAWHNHRDEEIAAAKAGLDGLENQSPTNNDPTVVQQHGVDSPFFYVHTTSDRAEQYGSQVHSDVASIIALADQSGTSGRTKFEDTVLTDPAFREKLFASLPYMTGEETWKVLRKFGGDDENVTAEGVAFMRQMFEAMTPGQLAALKSHFDSIGGDTLTHGHVGSAFGTAWASAKATMEVEMGTTFGSKPAKDILSDWRTFAANKVVNEALTGQTLLTGPKGVLVTSVEDRTARFPQHNQAIADFLAQTDLPKFLAQNPDKVQALLAAVPYMTASEVGKLISGSLKEPGVIIDLVKAMTPGQILAMKANPASAQFSVTLFGNTITKSLFELAPANQILGKALEQAHVTFKTTTGKDPATLDAAGVMSAWQESVGSSAIKGLLGPGGQFNLLVTDATTRVEPQKTWVDAYAGKDAAALSEMVKADPPAGVMRLLRALPHMTPSEAGELLGKLRSDKGVTEAQWGQIAGALTPGQLFHLRSEVDTAGLFTTTPKDTFTFALDAAFSQAKGVFGRKCDDDPSLMTPEELTAAWDTFLGEAGTLGTSTGGLDDEDGEVDGETGETGDETELGLEGTEVGGEQSGLEVYGSQEAAPAPAVPPMDMDPSDGKIDAFMLSDEPPYLRASGKQISTVAELDAEIEALEEKLNSVGDDAQLANVDLQNNLQKQQQTLQMMSNVSKQVHDGAMAVIRKIGG